VVTSIGVILLELDRDGDAPGWAIALNAVKGVVRSPLVLSAVGGLLVSWSGLTLPPPMVSYCAILGAAAGPSALFAMGLFMVGKPLRAGLTEVGWITFLKLAFMPLVTYWLAFEVFRLDLLWAQASVILAALPTGGLMFILAQRYNVYVHRTTASIMVSTAVAMVTLSILFLFLGVA